MTHYNEGEMQYRLDSTKRAELKDMLWQRRPGLANMRLFVLEGGVWSDSECPRMEKGPECTLFIDMQTPQCILTHETATATRIFEYDNKFKYVKGGGACG